MARILLCDDDEQTGHQVGLFLRADSHDVDWLPDGKQGLDALLKEKYDLIILDWEMPGLTGPELCREYRKTGGTSPVLMLTGQTSVDHKEEGLESGADDYLTKPFDLRELRARVRAMLRSSARMAEGESSRKIWANIETSEQDPFLGKTIADKYELVELIGMGGMGVVYKAYHNVFRRNMALKILLPHLAISPDVRARFQQEAEAASRLSHPNIVSVHDFGMAARGLPFIVMDFFEGISLADIIEQEHPIDFSRSIDILTQVCEGMQHAHDKKVVHRDLKPSNVVVLKDGTARVLDFGLAKPLPDDGYEPSEKLTKTGLVFGSPDYMSPEQCRGQNVDWRSDIYSLGCLMYEVLSGTPPFASNSAIDTIKKQVREVPGSLGCHGLSKRMLKEAEIVVNKAMAKNLNERYQSMAEVKEELLKLRRSLVR